MMHNVEDVLEILSGQVPRTVNIRIDRSDKSLMTSLGRQVHKGLALTDRQLALALLKIVKYRDGLIANSVDVDQVLSNKPLRLPLRNVDRTQRIYFDQNNTTIEQRIYVKYIFSKKLDDTWNEIKNSITGDVVYDKSIKSVAATERNLYVLVEAFKDQGFDIDPEITEIYEKIDEILKNSRNYTPQVDLEDDQFVLKNVSNNVVKIVNEKFPMVTDNNFVNYLTTLKSLEIFHKNPKISEKIDNLDFDSLTKSILKTPYNKVLLNSEKYNIDQVINVVNNLDQWPMLVVLEDRASIFDDVVTMFNVIKPLVPQDSITVFFRLSKGQNNADEFNQFVKENHLNNYIDEKTKVVFILKDRIPKPLLKASWYPQTALVLTNYDYGRIGAYINNFKNVYYFNNSIVVQTLSNRSKFLVEL